MVGFCGIGENSVFERCYSAGFIDGDGWYYGGFCSWDYGENCSFVDCYWDTESSVVFISDGGTGKSTADMQDQSTFVNWDFMNVWYMDGYPSLRCFDSSGPLSGTYEAWLLDNPAIPVGMTDHNDAPAGDNVPNLLKYACGLEAMDVCTTADLMTIDSSDPAEFAIIYYKSKSALDVTLQPIWAETLAGPWTTVGMTLEKLGEDSEREQWRASIPLHVSGFIRLRAITD